MTVAVNIDRPDVVPILCKEIHERVVANLEVKIGTSRPRASVHKKRNFAAGREGAFQTCFVFLPEIDSEAIPDRVMLFATNRIAACSGLFRVSPKAIVGTNDCTGDYDENQKPGDVSRGSQHGFVPPPFQN